MNRKLITAAVLVAMMGVTGAASAQRHDNSNDRRGGPDFSHHDERRNDRNDYRQDDRRDHDRRGAGPRHDLHKGGRLPPEYRSRQYVVSDWRSHRLSAPPRGYHWVQTGSDYVLVGITTGLIAGLLLAN
ncbi:MULTISPECIES: RcnB family protein [unclassified Duganella]|jgi:Ni/Co efflux regulator RcnB|uniref:RcnB family protein n=1 Tax=unclassified Duganella TaxID=2636909 RepID=UPI0008899DED|nr:MULTISPECIES: RcnB family protein [unclassified Duganella]SDG56694.1 regulator RcnB of Ni and Co efflux [Duganella sp. OV458]SDJ79666.1 regulator RcnB of Ni and Co efflux [Duganella sp. OV510]